MKIEEIKDVTTLYLTEVQSLDPITVHLHDAGPGAGSLTVCCYGEAWTMFWGAMGLRRVEEFVVQCDSGYLAGKLAAPKPTKIEKEYLMRIADAVIEALRSRRVPA